MFNRLKSIFRSRTPPKQLVRARFDAAQTTRDNWRHWSAADHLSADMEAAPEVRRTLRMRSRYEVANNSYARGLVLMLANDTIGTGPRLQMLSADETFNDAVETAFMRWSDAVRLAPKLRTMRMARCQDGEAFAVLATNPKIRHGVKLDLQLIEADRVSGELRWFEDDTSVDGISYDRWGNPTDYRVLKYHPGDIRYMPGDDAIHIPAEYMIHIFRQDRPGLHRGVPEITPALPLFAQLRRYNLAVLSAAEAAADFAAILYTDAPPNGESDDVEPMDAIPLERNMMLTVPAGWKMGQLDPKQPAANHAEFVKIILSEIARCVVTTYGTLAGDFSGHNYASGRLDNQIVVPGIPPYCGRTSAGRTSHMVLGRLPACRSVEGSHRSGNPADEQHNDSCGRVCQGRTGLLVRSAAAGKRDQTDEGAWDPDQFRVPGISEIPGTANRTG